MLTVYNVEIFYYQLHNTAQHDLRERNLFFQFISTHTKPHNRKREKYLIFLQANISISIQDTYKDKCEKIHMDRYNNQRRYIHNQCVQERESEEKNKKNMYAKGYNLFFGTG